MNRVMSDVLPTLCSPRNTSLNLSRAPSASRSTPVPQIPVPQGDALLECGVRKLGRSGSGRRGGRGDDGRRGRDDDGRSGVLVAVVGRDGRGFVDGDLLRLLGVRRLF